MNPKTYRELYFRLSQKIYENGFLWALIRAKRELRSPELRITKIQIKKLQHYYNCILKVIRLRRVGTDNCILNTVYDMGFSPVTFDFVFFLIGCELHSRINNKSKFFIWIIRGGEPPATDGGYYSLINKNKIEWRFQNIIIPLISLHPKCAGFAVVQKFSDISVNLGEGPTYPEYIGKYYRPALDYREIFDMVQRQNFDGLCSMPQGLNYIRSWVSANDLSGPIVTITIRQYAHDESRNSNLCAWRKFAELISKEGFIPVFIPDTDSAFEFQQEFQEFIVFSEASWNLGLRMALYEEAFLNFFVSNGPAAVAHLNKRVRYVTMKIIVEGCSGAEESVFLDRGMEIGARRFSFATDHQILSWKDDSYENICEEFYNFLEASEVRA